MKSSHNELMGSNRVRENRMKTTQGRLLNGSIGGCSVIAQMVAVAGLIGKESASNTEMIIDYLCQEPLEISRAKYYPGLGFVHINFEEGIRWRLAFFQYQM